MPPSPTSRRVTAAATITPSDVVDRDDTPVGAIRPIPLGELASADDLVDSTAAISRARGRTNRRRSPLGVVVRIVAVLVLGGIVYYGISLFQVWSTGRSDQARPVDAIVVLGAAQYDGTPSPQLAARLDHAADLYAEGLAPIVLVTGGNQPGDRFTEAQAGAAYLVERGVPAGAIQQEGEGRSTYESLASAADMLESQGLDEVLIVTDPFHSLRSRLIAQSQGLTAYVSPTPSSVVTGGEAWRHNFQEAAGVALGRIIGFDRI